MGPETFASVTTSTAEVVTRFAAGNTAYGMLVSWRETAPAPVVEMVRTHVTATPYTLHPRDIEALARRTAHALGNIRKADVDPCCQVVRDWYAPLTFNYAFHYLLEKRGSLFTWQEWLEAYQAEPLIKAYLADPAEAMVAHAVTLPGEENSVDAWTWRMGNAYYSFLRELYVLVGARASGFDVRLHPLADVLYRADAWLDCTTISLYVPNNRYRDSDKGRKPETPRILRDSPTPWNHHHIALTTKAKYGKLNTPDPQDVITAMATIRNTSAAAA